MRLQGFIIVHMQRINAALILCAMDSALKAENVLVNLHLKRLCQTCFGNAFMNVIGALVQWIKSDIKVDSFSLITHAARAAAQPAHKQDNISTWPQIKKN